MRSSSGTRTVRFLLVTLLLLVLGFAWLVKSTFRTPSPGEELSLDELYRLADSGQILSAKLLDEDAQVVGTLCRIRPEATVCAPADAHSFHADYPRSDVATSELIRRLSERGSEVVIDKQNGKAVSKLIITFVFPLLMLANLFGIILTRGGEGSLGEIAGFGRLGRKRQAERDSTGVTFDDVAGVDHAIVELREVIEYLVEPEKFEAYAAAAPKGVLLFGPPGCGKTLLARAVAGESGVPFISVSGTEFVESLVGVGAARVRDLFDQVRDVAPAIVFIDEIDAVGRKREGEGVSGGEREQTLNQLLVEMDGFAVTSGLVLMGATNRPDILDPALLRPGRFDRHITLEAPDLAGRQAILQVHSRTKPMAPDVDFDLLARRTPGFTGADLSNVINEAALLAIREGTGDEISAAHVSEAVQRVLHGPHRGKLMTPAERERIAFHEAGHAVVTAAFGQRGDLNRVSIIARGRGLGTSTVDGGGDRVLLTAEEIEAQLSIAMGGISAEELRYGRASTTGEDDIEKATGLAREMVGLYGMSPEIGKVRVMSRYSGFLGTDGGTLKSVSERTMEEFDAEVKHLINVAAQRATRILTDHAPELERLVRRLKDEETVEGTALDAMLSGVRRFTVPAPNGSAGAGRPAAGDRPAKV